MTSERADELSSLRAELAKYKERLGAYDDTQHTAEATPRQPPQQQDWMAFLACRTKGPNATIETSIEELEQKLIEMDGMSLLGWNFAQLLPHEQFLQQVVARLVASNAQELEGPAAKGTLFYISPNHFRRARDLQDKSLAEAGELLAQSWRDASVLQKEWRAMLKNLQAGNYTPIASRAILFSQPGSPLPSISGIALLRPAIVIRKDGSRWWALLHQALNPTPVTPEMMPSLQDMLAMKHASSYLDI